MMQKKNEHLVPDMIKDMCQKFEKIDKRSGEFSAVAERLTTIRDYIDLYLKVRNFK